MEIDEKIEIVRYSPEWPELYEYEKKRLYEALDGMVLGIEHIGSTAVPGMWAKSIVDIILGVKSLRWKKCLLIKLLAWVMHISAKRGVGEAAIFS